LKISFFEFCRPSAASIAGVLFLTAASVLTSGSRPVQAQDAVFAQAIPVQAATAEGSAVPDAPKPQAQTEAQGQTIGQGQATPQGGAVPQGQTQGAGQTPAPTQPTTQQGQTQSSQQDDRHPQTNRILDIIPNFRAVTTDEKLPPMSVRDKFMGATEDSFDYSAIFIPLILAGYSDETKATPEFGDGWPAYARYFWHTAVDQTSENYWVEFIVPSITHEDTRYYTLGRGGFLKRAGYALSRAVVTRNDAGKDVFNFSEVVGAGAASGVSSIYYPTRERSLGNTGLEWGLDVAIDSMSFVVKEFWPDVNHALFHKGQSQGSH
jgi:hypothetical protein